MRKVYCILIAVLCFMPGSIQAQDCDIALSVIVPAQPDVSESVRSGLENKLRVIATQNGLAANSQAGQFALTGKLSLVEKRILPGPPPQVSYTLNVHLYIVDQKGENIFSALNVEAKGVGNNEQKAYADAIRRIPTRSKDAQQFVATGRTKILNYYNSQYPSILKRAHALAGMKSYDAALFEALSIPQCCDGYDEALTFAVAIYQKYVDQVCEESIAGARTIWMAEQNAPGAAKAGRYLANIYPDAACYAEAMALYHEIKNKIADDWAFEMKKYDDSIALEQQRMEMMKSVGEAYGSGQQPSTTNLMWLK